MDPNQWLIDEGIRHELGEPLLEAKQPVFSNNADFALNLFGRKFDFLMAQSIFSHTSQAQMRTIFNEAAKVMHENSIFLATYIPGKTDYMGAEWSYPDGVEFTFERIRAFATEVGLECDEVNWVHPKQQWLVFYHQANSALVIDRLRAANDEMQRRQEHQ